MKKEKVYNILPYIFVLIALCLVHYYLGYAADDLWFAKQLSKTSYIGFLTRRYKTWSSRLVIEAVLITLTRQKIVIWKVLNIFMMMLGMYLSIYFVNPKKNKFITTVGCLLFMLYPLLDMSTAGWAATTLNYLWCFSLGLVSFIPLVKYERKESINKILYIFSILGLVYAANQEQMCAIIFGMNFLYLVHKIIKKEKISKYNIVCLVITFISLIFILTCPGNSSRSIQETATWYPEFKKYGVLQKSYLGIVSMFSTLVSNKTVLLVFVSFLSLACYIYSTKKISKTISIFNFVITLANTIFMPITTSIYPGMQKIYDVLNYQGIPDLSVKYSLIPFVFCIIFIIDILYMLNVIFKKENLLPAVIFLAGICSKFIIGFSPTIFASGARAAFYLYMSLIIVTLIVINKLNNDKKLNENHKYIITAVLVSFSLLNYLNVFTLLR